MTDEQIREVVKMTVEELSSRNMIKADYQTMLKSVEKRLYEYFNGTQDKELTVALTMFCDDPYIDTIYLQYRDGKTLEWIAEYFDKDTRTIMRNKKRLITKLYEDLSNDN